MQEDTPPEVHAADTQNSWERRKERKKCIRKGRRRDFLGIRKRNREVRRQEITGSPHVYIHPSGPAYMVDTTPQLHIHPSEEPTRCTCRPPARRDAYAGGAFNFPLPGVQEKRERKKDLQWKRRRPAFDCSLAFLADRSSTQPSIPSERKKTKDTLPHKTKQKKVSRRERNLLITLQFLQPS